MVNGAGKGLVAGAVDVAAMTLGAKAKQALTHRPNSFVPAHTLEGLLGAALQARCATARIQPSHAQAEHYLGLELTQFPGHPESWRQGRPREVRDGTHLPSRVPP